MSNENDTKLIKEINGCKWMSYINDEYFVVPKPLSENTDLNNYINMTIDKYDDESTFIKMESSEYTEDVFMTIARRIHKDYSLQRILDDISEIYLKIKSKYEKFRGDYAEAAYLAFVGGKSIPDGETFDIEHNGDYIEIKSYSPQSKTIIISLEQIRETSLKLAYPLIPDKNGKSILELAKIIENSNPEFSKKLISKYSSDSVNGTKKYARKHFADITDQLQFDINTSENVISGKLKIFINVFHHNNYNVINPL